jgi:hypothetical protein
MPPRSNRNQHPPTPPEGEATQGQFDIFTDDIPRQLDGDVSSENPTTEPSQPKPFVNLYRTDDERSFGNDDAYADLGGRPYTPIRPEGRDHMVLPPSEEVRPAPFRKRRRPLEMPRRERGSSAMRPTLGEIERAHADDTEEDRDLARRSIGAARSVLGVEKTDKPHPVNPFYKVATLEALFDIHDVDELVEVTVEAIAATLPNELHKAIYSANSDHTMRFKGLAVNRDEYGSFVRDPEKFLAAAVRAIESTDEYAKISSLSERRQYLRAELAGSLQKKIADMTHHLEDLDAQTGRLVALTKQCQAPMVEGSGASQVPEPLLNELISRIWSSTFNDILEVAAANLGWDQDQLAAARIGLKINLLTGTDEEKSRRWNEMTQIAEDYLGKKKTLFSVEIAKTQRIMDEDI